MSKPLPTPEMLRKLLRYDPETGKLFWRERTPGVFPRGGLVSIKRCESWNVKYMGKEALRSVNLYGYLYGSLMASNRLAHRVSYAIHYGTWPKNTIDHINGDRADNRILNLRDVTQAENCRNSKISTNNTSGHKGVYWRKDCSRWQAYIGTGKGIKYLGQFKEKGDAVSARKTAEKIHDYHPNNGRT